MKQFSTAAISWLCIILEERFGHAFTLVYESSGLKLTLSDIEQGSILFTKLEMAFHQSLSNIPYSEWDTDQEGWISVLGKPLPSPGVSELPKLLIEQKSGQTVIHYDILGLTYWMLNRIEEIGSKDLDSHGRFPAINSHAYKHGYLERPIVDEWLNILGQAIQKQWPQVALKQHEFIMKVSHDVDMPSRYAFRSPMSLLSAIAGDVFKYNNMKGILLALWIRLTVRQHLHPADLFNTFDWIMDQSESIGIVSSFYFICGRTDISMDGDYEIEHPIMCNLMRNIHERGHKVGLHPSYGTYQEPALISKEANRLRKVMDELDIKQEKLGGRMHYLRWEQPKTLQAWNDAGMTYDSSLGYADRPGFRCGTCHEYPAFNAVTQKLLHLRVRPLVAMECSVMAKGYSNLGDGEEAFNKFIELKKTCRLVSGSFTLLWHNSELIIKTKRSLYKRILNEV
jgi:hypothetical protein